MKKLSVIAPMYLLLSLSLFGCLDKSSDNKKVANVELKSMTSVEGSGYKAGQVFNVTFTTETQLLETEHVGVSFILIQRDKVEQLETSEEPEGYFLDEFYIEQLQPGEQSHTAKLMIPNVELTAGEYIIAAYIDTSGVILDETDTDDNKSRGIESGDETTYASIDIAEGKFHDFILDKARVGDGFAVFPGPGKRDTSDTGTPLKTEPDLIGFIKATKRGDAVNHADITANITIGEVTYVAHLWNEMEQEYAQSMQVIFPDHEQSHFFPWDIGINGTLLKAIHDNFDPEADINEFTLEFTIHDPSANLEADTDNNTITFNVPYVLYHDEVDTEESKAAEKTKAGWTAKVGSWNATYGDSDVVAISPSFYSYTYLTSQNNGFASALAEGNLDLYLFDDEVSLLSANADAMASVDSGEVYYGITFDVLDVRLLNEGDTISALDEYYGYNWSEEQTIVSATFTIVIVPVTVEAGVSGSLDIGAGLVYNSSRLELGGDIVSASLDAYATAEINLGIASGGVGVDFLIISDTFNVTAYADFTDAISNSEITFGLEMTNDIEAISGEFYLYVSYPYYKWCCKIKTKTKTETLYETDSLYDKTWVILDESATFSY